MRQRRKVGVWVRGHIAEFSPHSQAHGDVVYLIDAVRPDEHGKAALVDFRSLRDWRIYRGDRRELNGSVYSCTIRKPTDEELALIAKQSLLKGLSNG